MEAGRLPDLSGGEQSTMFSQSAMNAGIANMRTVENKGADPPGMYNPTDRSGTGFCQQVIPFCISTFILMAERFFLRTLDG